MVLILTPSLWLVCLCGCPAHRPPWHCASGRQAICPEASSRYSLPSRALLANLVSTEVMVVCWAGERYVRGPMADPAAHQGLEAGGREPAVLHPRCVPSEDDVWKSFFCCQSK